MKSAGQIRCSVYLHADQYPEDAALVHRIASARLGRRAQQFLALVRSGIIAEQTPILQQDITTQVIAHQTPLGRRTVTADVKLVVAWMVKFMQSFSRLDLSPFDDLLSYRVDPDSSEPPRRVPSCV